MSAARGVVAAGETFRRFLCPLEYRALCGSHLDLPIGPGGPAVFDGENVRQLFRGRKSYFGNNAIDASGWLWLDASMSTRMERINAALAALDGWSTDKISEASRKLVSARTVRYLRSGRPEMKREPNEATVIGLETAVEALKRNAA